MATLKDFRDERLRKLGELKELGVNPYPASVSRTHSCAQISGEFESLEGKEVSIAGRIVGIRKFGKIAFIVVRDASGKVQLFLRGDSMSENPDFSQSQVGMAQLNLLDSGDFIQATGQVIKTQTGEISVAPHTLRLLTKALRPLPSEIEGFTNKEERLRRRYVDINVNHDVYDRFVRRSLFWKATRDFLESDGFIEINTPVLEHTTGGADANPFVTHMYALDQDFYLRISHELPLKRLIGAGYEKVFDIGPRFRNENYSDEHLPEHVAMEWYWAYADWNDGMALMERMFAYVLEKTFGRTQFSVRGFEIDFSRPWERMDYAATIKGRYGIDIYNTSIEEVTTALKANKLEVEKAENLARGIDKLWKNIRKDVAGPAWLINTPAFISPLAKSNTEDPRTVQRFQAVIAGSELCNGYSELNDPLDQLARFLEQQNMRDAGDAEAQMLDIDYVEMLEYGMPPTCGLGFSERVFWFFEGVTAREGVPFPQLRSEVDEVTKSIYPDVDFSVHQKTSETTEPMGELPESAAEQGTHKLYLDNYALLQTEATVQSVQTAEDGRTVLVLDQTCFYPGGGGQACDTGAISWQGGSLIVEEASKDKEGIVLHTGTCNGSAPAVGQSVVCAVDAPRRQLNSRLHCAGHLIDKALKDLGKNWKSGKSAHYPHMSFVDYSGDFIAEESDSLARAIEQKLYEYATKGGEVGVVRVSAAEAKNRSDYIPDVILKMYQNVHVATYPDGFNICCGGTHLTNLNQLGKVTIKKIKKKDGAIRVSYELAD